MSEKHIDLGLKAFAISLARMIAEDPTYIHMLVSSGRLEKDREDWLTLQDSLSDPGVLARFAETIENDASNTEWSSIDFTALKWAEYGWSIGDPLFKLCLWECIPQTQKEADTKALQYINKAELEKIWQDTTPGSLRHKRVFSEACDCFQHKCYTACASLLVSLIDGTIISSKANNKKENLKTGSTAQNRVSEEILKNDTYRLPGYFHWEHANYHAAISFLFERANNFSDEPPRINRNYLHHGMSKRKVLRKDCIKLFLLYKHALSYC